MGPWGYMLGAQRPNFYEIYNLEISGVMSPHSLVDHPSRLAVFVSNHGDLKSQKILLFPFQMAMNWLVSGGY